MDSRILDTIRQINQKRDPTEELKIFLHGWNIFRDSGHKDTFLMLAEIDIKHSVPKKEIKFNVQAFSWDLDVDLEKRILGFLKQGWFIIGYLGKPNQDDDEHHPVNGYCHALFPPYYELPTPWVNRMQTVLHSGDGLIKQLFGTIH